MLILSRKMRCQAVPCVFLGTFMVEKVLNSGVQNLWVETA